jgi:hypothetical protein
MMVEESYSLGGAIQAHHPARLDGRASLGRLLLRQSQITRLLSHAENRASGATGWHIAIWGSMAAQYRAELATVEGWIAARQRRTAAQKSRRASPVSLTAAPALAGA